MSAFGHASERILRILAAAGLALAAAPMTWADTPGRVVSMNLCTDLLAMRLAGPGQLISVSDLARDPLTSPMADVAQGYPVNHASAEEIYLLDPDLVLAGVYSDPATIAMLRRLGLQVVQIDIARRLSDVPDRIAEVGALLGRDDTAAGVIAEFEADLARLAGPPDGMRAAFYYPNGYTLGTGTLAHDILTTAGYRNIAEELGRQTSGQLALELLVLLDPALVVSSTPYPGASRSEEILSHPALQALVAAGHRVDSGPDWICGTPDVLSALAELAAARTAIGPER